MIVPYVETPADAAFTAFLAGLTPSKVLRDRERTFTREEKRRQKFLREKAKWERLRKAMQEGEANG